MWTGVVNILAGVKFSGSPKIKGYSLIKKQVIKLKHIKDKKSLIKK